MANNEGVEIIIKATDQYTKTINNITASNELFGKSVKNIEKEISTLENYMVKLVANGMSPASASIKILQTNLDQLKGTLTATQNAANGAGGAIAGSANNLKKSNQSWTALSLVVQDLPYGFRGIQNNLPALIGGIVGIGGAAYFAFSAIIATLTALDSGLISFGGKVKLATDYNKEFAQSLAEQKVKLDSLYSVATNANKSMDDRISAAKKLKEEYPKLLENFSAEDIAAGKATSAYNKLSAAVVRYAKAQAAQTAIKEIVTKQIENDLKIAEKELEYKAASASADKEQIKIDKKSLIFAAGTINLERVRASTIKDNVDGLKAQNKQLDIQLSKFEDIYNANASSELDTTKPGGKTPEQLQRERDQKLLKAQEVQVSNYLDTLNERNKEITQSELKLQEDLATLNAAGFTDYENAFLANRLRIAAINKKYKDKELEEAQKIADKVASIQLDMRFKMESALASINEQFAKDDVKNANIKLKATLRATRGNYQAQKSAIEQAIADNEKYKQSAIDAGYGTEVFDKSIANLKSQLEGLVDPLENFNNSLTNIINKTLEDLAIALGEGLGQLLAGGDLKSVLNSFLSVLTEGLISVGKLAIATGIAMLGIKAALESMNPFAAIAAGIALVALGTAVKAKLSDTSKKMGGTKKFANGGIISGPTMGLMGEYPGASANPEVVAPLDKLKDMIGGGSGGTFVLRGQDLLLSVNRAQKASNLKGQNINLA
jgi:hypothetical protein